MNTIETLELIVRNWYLHHGFCNNETSWFCIITNFRYKDKVLCVIDETGLAPKNRLIFQSKNTEEVIEKAIKHYRETIVCTKEDLKEINEILDKEIS